MNQVDPGLWRAFALRRDEEAFRPLYEATRGLAYTLCLRLLRRAEDADDAFQAAYCRLLAVARDPALAREVDDVAAFLCLLVRREADNLRKHRRRRAAREEPFEETRVMRNDPPAPQLAAERAELRARIESLVEALPDRYRLPVLLHYFHGLSQREVARALGESASTISDRIRAALGKLAQACRRAGLGDAASTLAGIALAAALVEPSVSAGAVLAQARAAALGGGTAAALSPKTHLPITSTTMGALAVKTKVALVMAVVVFCALLLTGYIALRPSRPKLEPQPVAAIVPPPAEPAAAAAPGPRVVPAGGSRETTERPAPVEVADVISGFVRDVETGSPIPGAVVRSGDREAHADESGSYSLRGAGPGMQTVTASARGYAKRPAMIDRAGPGETALDFQLDPAGTVRLKVVDEDGGSIAGARVVQPMFGSEHSYYIDDYVETDARGEVLLTDVSRLNPPRFHVGKEGFKAASAPKPEMAPGAEATGIEVVLQRIKVLQRAIVGRVTDEQRRPIAGATIEWKDGEGTSFGPDAVYGQFKAASGKDGYYRLEYLDDYGQCELGVAARGRAPLVLQGVKPGTPEEPAVVNFTLEPAHWLGGKVVDEEGRAVARVRITVMPRLGLARSAVAYPSVLRQAETDAEGKFFLEELPGPTVGAELRGPPGGGWPGQEEETPVDQDVLFVLRRLGVIRGRVLDRETGEPVRVFNIRITSGPIEVSRGNPGEAFSDAEGKFVLKNLGRDVKYGLLIEAEGYLPGEAPDLSPEPEGSAAGHEVALARGAPLEGVVFDAATGSPLAEAKVAACTPETARDLAWIEWDDHETLRQLKNVQRTRTDANGAFRLLEEAPLVLFLRASGYQRLAVQPAERARFTGPGGRLSLPLEAAAVLRGVSYHDGKPRPGAWVGLHLLTSAAAPGGPAGREFQGGVKADEKGGFRWDDLRPGTYLLEALRITDATANTGVRLRRKVEIEAAAGETADIGADLGDTSFRGRVLDRRGEPLPGASLLLRPQFPWIYEALVADLPPSAHGRFLFDALRPGRYAASVEVVERDGEVRTIALPPLNLVEDLELDFEVDLEDG